MDFEGVEAGLPSGRGVRRLKPGTVIGGAT